jgi:cell division protein FtsB
MCDRTCTFDPLLVLSRHDVRSPHIYTSELPAFPIVPRRRARRFWPPLLLFVACVLLVNGLFGERGLLATIKARQAYAAAARDLARLRQANQTLRERARQLRSDPRSIEAVARGELGLAGADEIVVTVRDLGQPPR